MGGLPNEEVWRHVLRENDGVDQIDAALGKYAKNGDVLKHSRVLPNGVSGEPSFVTNDVLVVLDSTGSSLTLISLQDGDVRFHQANASDFEGNKIELAEKIVDLAAVSDALILSDGQQAFATLQQDESTIHLIVKLVNDLRDRSDGFRALVVMEDHSLHLLQQGDIVWSREDGLASIIDMTTSELPLEKEGVSVA
ncbi:hypothetical protein QJS10_CPA07g00797 [Acorus calamus]|uniref:EMC1 first beta-propeller domain-containing protein n=1 Tax=Acorus calamus TaxID=4465 RepID=A0AAV9EE79_ACOCL|nr:hypothetical protein QJS10_CPA07g00797 [Acorus calamus]